MRRARSKLQVSTFPFLAVLLAAMGALILLLLIMDFRSKIVARNKARERWEAKERERSAREAERLAAWQREQDAAHEAAEQRGQRERLRERDREAHVLALANEEKRLSDELTKVQTALGAAAADLKKEQIDIGQYAREQDGLRKWLAESSKNLEARRLVGTLTQEQEIAANKTLRKMTAELARMEKILADLKARPKKDNVFSLVPYRGKHGDSRRPIYVECSLSGVTFQPQGRTLSFIELERDRIREEIRRCGLELAPPPKEEEPADGIPRSTKPIAKTGPYVLCLVRPNGIEAYGAFMKALNGYDVDFGYELIDAHWELDFSRDKLAGAESTPGGGAPKGMVPGIPTSRPGSGGPFADGSDKKGGTGGREGSGVGPGFGGVGGTGVGGGTGPVGPRLGSPLGIGSSGPGGLRTGDKGGGTGGGKEKGFDGPPGLGAPGSLFPGKGSATTGSLPKDGIPGKGLTGGDVGKPGSSPGGGLNPSLPKGSGLGSGTQPKKDDVAWRGSKTPGKDGPPSKDPMRNPDEEKDRPPPERDPENTEGTPGPGNRGGGEEGPAILSGDPLAKSKGRPPSLGFLIANRDFVIPIACTETEAILTATGQGFPTNGAIAEQSRSGEALVAAVRMMIARRQASVRPGEAPYRPMIRFQVYPGGLRTYYRVYPLLESLRVPMTRENIER